MDYETWIATHDPIQNILVVGASFDGMMFETYGEEFELVKKAAATQQVWTLRDDSGSLAITAGLGWVNRLGYFITEVPWTDAHQVVELD